MRTDPITEVESGIYEPRCKISVRLGTSLTIFQSETLAIKQYAQGYLKEVFKR